MKTQDIYFIIGLAFIFGPFIIFPEVLSAYKEFNLSHGVITSALKFGILATIGESIGLRITDGVYNKKGFGLLPRAIVWGFLGIIIKMIFVIFVIGVPKFLAYLGLPIDPEIIRQDFTTYKLLTAFSIATSLNLLFAPLMMTFHKITDAHIVMNGGTLGGLFKPIRVVKILNQINWDMLWGFVFKKTIPLFWIPAHTLTFLLPPQYHVLSAATLGIILGVILSFASLQAQKNIENDQPT